MLLSCSDNVLVHLFTDIHLNVVSGCGPVARVACTRGDLAGKNLTVILTGAAPAMLEQVKQQCLQQPGKSHRLRMRIGMADSNRKFSWVVCTLQNSAGAAEGLVWTGTEKTQHYKRLRKAAAQPSSPKALLDATLTNGEKGFFKKTNLENAPVFGKAATNAAGTSNQLTAPDAGSAALDYLQQRFEVAALISADIITDWDIEKDTMWRSVPSSNILVHAQKARSMHERFERVHADDRQRFISTLYGAMASAGNSWQCEYRYESGTVSNQYKVLNENARIIRNSGGKAVRLISVIHDVTEERKLEQELKQKEKEVIYATIEGQEAERKELSRELHDNVGQVLAMCKLFVEIAAGAVQHEYLDKCHEQLQRAMHEIRNLSHRLSPELLDHNGLPGAIASLTENINGTARLAIELDIDPSLHTLQMEKSIQITAYRIVQELINNILKHAHASKAVLHLWPEAGALRMHIKDDGTGFDPEKAAGGIGLRNIQNRAAVAGGKVTIQSAPGRGTRTLVVLPF